jgi:LuxR family transcriptional regulator, maltose regulon positive regulatory protein
VANPTGVSDTSVEVVKTKLRVPMLRSEHVPRPRLLELLEASSERRVTLIGAPAGYGKTTLLTQWCQSEKGNLPFAWVSLDEQDDDPVRLWRHVIEALRQVAPEEGFGADVLVGLGVVKRDLIETVLPMLINDLTELPHRVVLVLDDYHCVNETSCHESVAFFMEHLPHTVHLVLSTRSYPPLPLGRLRARGELDEIRTEQLAFLEEEATSLLEERLRLDISYDDLLVVLDRTEGWPAGIYLAALSLREKRDTRAFVESFRGSDRYIVDLLAEEILGALPEEVREFLLRTSILESMSGPLCDAVVGREGSGYLLRELAHANLFVVPLSEDGEWYRYHNLFAEQVALRTEQHPARGRAHPPRARRGAPPQQRDLHPGDGGDALRLSQHRKNPRQIHLSQIRRLLARKSRGAGPGAGAHLAFPTNPEIP